MERLNEKVKYTTTSCITNWINNWKLYDCEKVYVSMMKIVDSEFVIKHVKWGDDKSIYDANDEKSTSSSCWWAKIYKVVNCLAKLSRNYFEVYLVWVSHVT